jgi:hypothetical protein
MENFWKGAFLPLRKSGGISNVEFTDNEDGSFSVTFSIDKTQLEYEMDRETYEEWETENFSIDFYNARIRETPFPLPFGSPGFGNGGNLKDGK